ncbi:hypothetical protein WJX81_002686 [Elliptochloris bilobata]|uniref:ABC1 atypical kinase-like domain-containing protein n=1 Tax=Elliptochloris bilobata TaxID=381761 RepID=A0AAW1QYF9_9CHLO
MSDSNEVKEVKATPLVNALRTIEFWRRASGVYAAYKGAQMKAAALRMRGWDDARLKEEHWRPHHDWAGKEFYTIAVDLRGFYLKLGQFFAARAEFVPEPICRRLSLLHDQVPPMPPAQARKVIEEQLGAPLEDVFEEIDLEKPLGSASIAQVHKARLRRPPGQKPAPRRSEDGKGAPLGLRLSLRAQPSWRTVGGFGGGGDAGAQANRASDSSGASTSGRPAAEEGMNSGRAAAAAAAAMASRDAPADGIVAVKVQYPNALPTMMLDLGSIRRWAGFLQKTEINFDMLSAVDELASQVRLEFDFQREARIMDTVAGHLRGLRRTVEIPRSVPGLVTERLLVMTFLGGEQITRLKQHVAGLSALKRKAAAKLILQRVSEAYGEMMLTEGLFQADAHPGNILVMPGGRMGLLDFGQSKQLPERERLAFAALIAELARGRRGPGAARPEKVLARLSALGLRFERQDARLATRMAFGMFDTDASLRVDPFAADSPIKAMGIEHFPPDVFFVLRVMQLLRGLAGGMGVNDFSSARQWRPIAERALRRSHYHAD